MLLPIEHNESSRLAVSAAYACVRAFARCGASKFKAPLKVPFFIMFAFRTDCRRVVVAAGSLRNKRPGLSGSARNDFAVRAAVARTRDTARACRLACAIGHGRRARHPDSGSHATSRSCAAHQRKWRSRTHTSFSVFVSNNTNTNKKLKRQNDHQSSTWDGSQSAALRETQSFHFQIHSS